MANNRYFLMIIGSSKNIDEDLNNVADSELGVNFVDGSGLYMATFYSNYDLEEIYNFLSSRYGDWIVYKPKFNLNNFLLWALPYLFLIIGGIIIFNLIRKRKNSSNYWMYTF